jgi:hypothetical protein
VDPPTTEKELNPFAFPNGQAEANFLLALNNTGNGADSMTITSARPDAFNVTATPERIPIKILETKAILVTIKVNATVPAGEYELRIVGTSSLNRSVNCTATFRMTLFQLDGVANTQVQSYVQNPINPTAEVTQAIISPEVTQVEGYFVKFRVYIENRGDRALALGSATVTAVDTLECEIAPTGATNDTCGTRPLTTWTLPNNLIVGQTTFLEFVYFAPEYMCFVDTTVCARPDPPPPSNPHRIIFTLSLANEGNKTNNVAEVTVNVLPGIVVRPPPPVETFPVAASALGGIAIAGVVLLYWFRFIRPPKVDEDLYASIYGGAAPPADGAPAPDGIKEYFQNQSGPPPEVPQQYQGMSDQQLEEARRIYGDNFGR